MDQEHHLGRTKKEHNNTISKALNNYTNFAVQL